MWSQETLQETGLWPLAFSKGESPTPSFTPSQKPSLFSIPVSLCKTQTAAGMSSASCLTPWIPAGLPITSKCHSACHLISVSRPCPWCDSLVTYCKARAVHGRREQFYWRQWSHDRLYHLKMKDAEQCFFWKKQVALSNYSFSSSGILIHTCGTWSVFFYLLWCKIKI